MLKLPALHDMPFKGEDEADEACLLYIAMIRIIDCLVMMHRDHSSFTLQVHEAIRAVSEHLAGNDAVASAG